MAARQVELMFSAAANAFEETAGYKLNCPRMGWAKSKKLPARYGENMTLRTWQTSKTT